MTTSIEIWRHLKITAKLLESTRRFWLFLPYLMTMTLVFSSPLTLACPTCHMCFWVHRVLQWSSPTDWRNGTETECAHGRGERGIGAEKPCSESQGIDAKTLPGTCTERSVPRKIEREEWYHGSVVTSGEQGNDGEGELLLLLYYVICLFGVCFRSLVIHSLWEE